MMPVKVDLVICIHNSLIGVSGAGVASMSSDYLDFSSFGINCSRFLQIQSNIQLLSQKSTARGDYIKDLNATYVQDKAIMIMLHNCKFFVSCPAKVIKATEEDSYYLATYIGMDGDFVDLVSLISYY